MGHRKQLTSFAPSFLIISSEHPARDTAKQTALTDHPPSMSEPLLIIRPASLPVPLVERAGRDDTASKQRRNLITLSRPPSASSHSTAPRTATGTATGHRTWHDTDTERHPSKQGETPDIIVSPLPVANRREARTGQDGDEIDDIARTADPTSTGKQANRPPPHRLIDKTDGTRNGPPASPPQRDGQAGRERTRADGNARNRT